MLKTRKKERSKKKKIEKCVCVFFFMSYRTLFEQLQMKHLIANLTVFFDFYCQHYLLMLDLFHQHLNGMKLLFLDKHKHHVFYRVLFLYLSTFFYFFYFFFSQYLFLSHFRSLFFFFFVTFFTFFFLSLKFLLSSS